MSESSELRNAFRVARQGGGITDAISGFGKSAYSSASTAISSARQKLTKKGFTFKGEVNVAGERVRLDVSGFDPKRFVDVVSFPEKYFPNEDINSDRVIIAKGIFSKLFTPGGDFDEVNPVPPQDSQEFAILQEALQNRFDSLRYEIINERNQQGDTAAVRAKLDHVQNLVTLLDKLSDPEISRADYSADGRIIGTPVTIDPKDNDRFLGLLRTFAYLVLQGVYKVPGMDFGIDVDSLLKSIESKIVSKDQLDLYIAAFQASGNPMPSVITEVLSSTKTSPGLLEKMVADKVEGLYTIIVQGIRQSLGAVTDESIAGAIATIQGAFEAKVNEMITSNTPYSDRIKNITLFLLEQNNAALKAKADADKLAEEAKNELGECRGKLEGLNNQYTNLLAERDRIADEKKTAMAASAQASGASALAREEAARLQGLLDRAAADCEGKIGPLKLQIESLTAQVAAAEGHAAGAENARIAAGESCGATQASITELGTRLAAAEGAAAREKARADTATEEAEKVRPLEDAFIDLTSQIEGLNAQLDALRNGAAAGVAATGGKIAELEAALAAAEAAKERVDGELEAAKAAAEEAAGVAAAAEATSLAAATERDAATTARADAERRADDLNNHLAGLKAVIDDKNVMLDEAAEDLQRLRDGWAAANEAQKEAERALAQATAAAEAAATAAAAGNEAAANRIQELEAEKATATAASIAARQAASDAAAAQKRAEEAKAAADAGKAAALAQAANELEQLKQTAEAAKVAAAAQLAAAFDDAGLRGKSKDQRIGELEKQLAGLSNQSTNITDLQRQVQEALRQSAESDSKYSKLIQALRSFSQGIANGTLTESDPVIRDNDSFLAIFEKIQGLKSGSGAEGQNTNRLYCLFTYYTNVFLHMFFIANGGELAYKLLSAIIDTMLKNMNQSMSRAANLFSLLDCLMPYVQSIESFLIKSSATTQGGYYQFQFDKQNDTFKTRSETFMMYVYPELEKYKDQILQTVNPLFIKSVSPKLLGTTSSGYILFINPIKTSMYPNGIAGNTPSILYLPDKNTAQSVLNARTAYTYSFEKNISSRISANQDTNLTNLFNNKFLTYDMILGLFIVMSQKYIAELSGTISSYCSIPPSVMDPLTSIKEKGTKTAAVSLKGIDDLPIQDREHFEKDNDYYRALYIILVRPQGWNNEAIEEARRLMSSKYQSIAGSGEQSYWDSEFPKQNRATGELYYSHR